MTRVLASLVVLLGIAAIGWVAVSNSDTPSAADSTPSIAETATAEPAPTESAQVEAEPAESTQVEPAQVEAEPAQTEPAPTEVPQPEPENYGPRMDLVNIDAWLQTDATSIDDFDGKVLLVEMWTFGCHNCKARIPHNQSYYQEFGDENFEMLGVHAPEFSYEAERAAIEEALVRLDVTWPQALDTSKKNFRDWQPGRTNYWPRTYVIDQNGDIRYDHIGEGRYEELRETIRHLIDYPPEPRPET